MIIQCQYLTIDFFVVYFYIFDQLTGCGKLTTQSTGAMRPSVCLRLARQSAAISQRCSTRSKGPFPRIGSSLTLVLRSGVTHFRGAARGLSSDTDKSSSRFAGSQDGNSESLSPFKQHRRDELREDQQSEDPLYADPYPRLESSTNRRSVPEFLDDFDERTPSEEVMLTGRVRSKRVVGKSLIFLDIVNEFQKVQIMINKNKCVSEKHGSIQKFSLFKNLIQVGDHICMIPVCPYPCLSSHTWLTRL